MNFFASGDTHGKNYQRICTMIEQYECSPKNSALIILGDAGFNFFLDKREQKEKKRVNNLGYAIYCVRGNHEERPENLDGIEKVWDNEVQGWVMRQPQFPNIKYFIDGNSYCIGGHSCLVIGGAYSVDKHYRLMRASLNGSSFTGWFPQEQLTAEEMHNIDAKVVNHKFDIVLTHTCPFDWQPIDLFLPSVCQSDVDNTMEIWLNKLKDKFEWKLWLWGHYHADRDYLDGKRYMLYREIVRLEDFFKND